MKNISVIIPCYNSEKSIQEVVQGIIHETGGIFETQVILVNDGSQDCVWERIQTICEIYPNVIGLSLSRNFGQQSARMAAIPYLTGEYVVFMDDDGQHDAAYIKCLVDKLEDGYDIAYAYFKKKKEARFRIWGSNFARKTVNFIMDRPKNVHGSSFFAARRYVVDELQNYHSPAPVLLGYFMKITKNITEVEAEHHERMYGKSGYSFKSLVHLWMDMFTSFSVIPLRIASFVGVVFSGLGMGIGAVYVIRKLLYPLVPSGYTSLISVILFSSGMIMLMLGMLGEYIGRIFIALNDVPQYVVKEKLNTEKLNTENMKTFNIKDGNKNV